ncbi:photosystem II stability/assembly factor-like protein [Marinobacter sp.]|uniref:photosystem II stability/assembly factor-like protein n=1 Tax=Marinobacter sp. TaxID=50741 RepID=UPI0034A3562D
MNYLTLKTRNCLAGVALLVSFPALANDAPDTLNQGAVESELARSSMLSAINFAGDRLVAVGVKGHVVLSDDEGESWRQAEHVPVSVTLTGVCFNNARDGWAVGHRGAILRTGDGGENWELQYDGFKAANDVHEALKKTKSDDAFYGEMMVEDGADKPFLEVRCLGEKQAAVVGAFGFAFTTTDGGGNWEPSVDVFEGTGQMHVYGIVPAGKGLVMAGERGALFETSANMSGFQQLPSPYDGTFFGLMDAGSGGLVAYGLRGHAYWSGDGGESWREAELDTNRSLTAGTGLANGNLLLVDNSGSGWVSRDNGHSFNPVFGDRSFAVTDLLQLNNGDVLATGARGFLRFSSFQLN